jgi:hypothetical protein
MNYGIEVVDLGFKFRYFDNDYTQVSISFNGYVCLGDNSKCSGNKSPSPHDILIGLNYVVDPTSVENGQIYHKRLDSNSLDFESAKIYSNLFKSDFEPQQIFMVTYDNVLLYFPGSTYIASFQIYLSTDSIQSFATFKFESCPKDLEYLSSSGLNYKRIDGSLREVIIANGQQCSGSNVGQAGVWVSDVTSKSNFKLILYPLRIIIN